MHLALKMIDPQITLQNAMTSIRTCLDVKKKAHKLSGTPGGGKVPRNTPLREIFTAYSAAILADKAAPNEAPETDRATVEKKRS